MKPVYKFTPIPLTWQSDTIGYGERLRAVLESWRNTPYMIGQQSKGAGVDCVRFVTAVWDELLGRDPIEHERLPRDASLNKPEASRAFMHLLLTRYAPVEDISRRTEVVEPGDVLVVGAAGGGPGHAIIVGPDKNTTWQAGGRKVIQTGWALTDRLQVLSHWFRFGDRHLWVK